MIATPNATTPRPPRQNSALFAAAITPSLKDDSEVCSNAELTNFSIIVYAVPSLRAQTLLPNHFETEDSIIDGRAMSLVSVISYLDLGSRRDGRDAFEHTSYRLHARSGERSVHWLLGASIGSLSAVARRQLWPMPCHLGAMEFRVIFGKSENRYLDYRLYTQSQWINASWEIVDHGNPLNADWGWPLLQTMGFELINDYFRRRDGSIGSRRIRMSNFNLTSGSLLSARCDLMEKLGLLSVEEMARPILVGLQPDLLCRFDAPQSESLSVSRSNSRVNTQFCT